MESDRIRLIELFGGIGSCTQAFKRLGIDFEVVDYVEVDKYPVASYNAMNGTNFEPQDISKWDKEFTDIDVIMHGSPCQDFSVAGHGRGGDEGSGTRSSLMYETLRIVEKIKPRIVIWENVKGLLSPKHKHNYEAYLQRMSDMGYKNYYQVLNAKHYGIPQNRERIFTVSIRSEHKVFEFPQKQELKLKLKDLLETDVNDNFYLSDKMLEKITWNTKGQEIIELANLNKGGERGPVYSTEGICSCLSATEYKQPKQIVENQCVQVGQMYGTEREPNPQAGRIYDPEGISPTMDTCSGGNKMPKVLVKEATKKGYAEAEEGDSINLEQPNSLTRRGRVGHGVAQTLTTSCQQAVIEPCVLRNERTEYGKAIRKDYESGKVKESRHNMVTLTPRTDGISNTLTTVLKDNILVEPFIARSIGRNPDNPSDRTAGAPTVQMLEPNSQGLCNTLTSVQKDNLVCEPANEHERVRIRKLTPLECWRLMGFDDEVFYKAQAVNSNTQLYKEAGNSIVVNVLYEILKQLKECEAL